MLERAPDPYLAGPYRPVDRELAAPMPVIEGEVPSDLRGAYVRNGPNPKHTADGLHHWFDGDGMLHAAVFGPDGPIYKNRWVRTPHLAREDEAGHALWRGLMEPFGHNPEDAPTKDTGNTDVLAWRGELLALHYIRGVPHRVDPWTLETRGGATLGEERPVKMSAHAKVDPETGELLFFDYLPRPPYLTYGVAGADGKLAHRTTIDLPGPRLPHDMAFTERFAVLMDLPLYFRPEAMKQGKWQVAYYDEQPARFGVLPRRAEGSEIRWFEAAPCYVYHVVNAWEEDDAVVMIGCRCDTPLPPKDPADGAHARAFANLRLRAKLHRWRFDLKTGETTETPLDDRNAEFPTIDDRRAGRRSRYATLVTIPEARTLCFDGLVRYDLETGARHEHAFGDGVFGSEAPFAPRVGSTSDDDGYVLSFVSNANEDRSELWIYDAADIARGPVTRLAAPQRVPLGFHATWIDGGNS